MFLEGGGLDILVFDHTYVSRKCDFNLGGGGGLDIFYHTYVLRKCDFRGWWSGYTCILSCLCLEKV